MGFTTEFLNNEVNNNDNNYTESRKQTNADPERRVGFVFDNNQENKDDPFEEFHQFYIQKQLKLHQSQGMPFILQNGNVVLPQSDVIERYVQDVKTKQNKDPDSDNEEEFQDTTMNLHSLRKNSLTSSGGKPGCVIS